MKDNYFKKKKKYEILNQKKKEEKEGQEWLKHIKETSDQYNKIKREFYREYLKISLDLKLKSQKIKRSC